TVKVEIKAASEADSSNERYCLFSISGYTIRFDGFTVLYDEVSEDDEEDKIIPPVTKGDVLKLKELIPQQHFTQPPARYTEASLIKTLEETGVGRPSTYATILHTIVNRGYVVKEGKSLKPTELGIATTNLLKEWFPKIVNTKFTARMESKLDDVEEGKTDYIEMLHGFYGEFEQTLTKAKQELVGVKIQLEEDKTDIVCEKCGRNMVVKVGRFGKFLACPGYPECKNTKPYVQKTAATCPKCGGDVITKRSKSGHAFYGCSNYPDCNFMTWDQPLEEKCPQCGSSLFKARGGVIKCHKESCGYEQKAQRKKKEKSEESDE
ncbi:MAG TPA: DNA topoisomerase, partial [Clostridiales bacterium]|nr:DNA topoisomerase [Clostridiales bacterium]